MEKDQHPWRGVELRGFALRAGNADLGTQQASSTLPWFFKRDLSFKGVTIADVSAFLATCRYIDDLDQFKRPEWWIHPVEFEELKRGDCEDHAVFAWRVLHDMGHDVRLMLGFSRGVGHAWVQYYEDKQSYVFETTAKRDIPSNAKSDYVPQYSFARANDGSFKMFGHEPDNVKLYAPEPLSVPEHWHEIDQLIFACKKNEAHRAIRLATQGKGSYTRQFLDRYAYLREHHPESFEFNDEAYWKDWQS